MGYDYGTATTAEESLLAGFFAGMFSVFWICVLLAIAVVGIIGLWKVFEKAGEEGWKVLIPFYNMYILFKITWGNGWLFLLLLIPVVHVVIPIITLYKLAKSFGKGVGFFFGLWFLYPVFIMILGFGPDQYRGGVQQNVNITYNNDSSWDNVYSSNNDFAPQNNSPVNTPVNSGNETFMQGQGEPTRNNAAQSWGTPTNSNTTQNQGTPMNNSGASNWEAPSNNNVAQNQGAPMNNSGASSWGTPTNNNVAQNQGAPMNNSGASNQEAPANNNAAPSQSNPAGNNISNAPNAPNSSNDTKNINNINNDPHFGGWE